MKQEEIDRLLREIQEQCGEDTDLASRYRDYAKVDADKALQQMLQRIHPSQAKVIPIWWRYRIAIAAALILFVTGGLFWYSQYTKVIPPQISEEVQLAMQRCEESGRQEATVDDYTEDQDAAVQSRSTSRRSSVRPAGNAKEQLLNAKRITTRQDREYWLTLPDGTIAHLNYNTHLIYPEQFTGDNRDVYLYGDAYLMVAHDARHPFIVHTEMGSIKVHGTEFSVNTRDTDMRTRVVLVKGSISVTMNGGEPQLMVPGDMALLYANHTKPVMSQVDTEPYVAWNTGTFTFEDCPLEKLMHVLSRWYGYHVQFDSEDIRQLTFTGDLDRYTSIEPALKAISWTMGLRVEINDGNIFISKH